VSSDGMMFTSNFMKISPLVQKLEWVHKYSMATS